MEKSIEEQNVHEQLQTRIHQLAIAKIMVFTHAKSDFRLVAVHFSIGKNYLEIGCY